jgi:hypothetical protein
MHGVAEVDAVYFRVASPTQRNEYGLTMYFKFARKFSWRERLNLFSVEHTNPFLPSIGTRLQDYGVVIHRV